MLSMNDVQLLWEVMSRCDEANASKIARIIRDDLNANYINKMRPTKKVSAIEGNEWFEKQTFEIRQTAEDFGEWLAENETNNRYLPEFQNYNKIALIKRFRTLSQAYYPSTYDDKPSSCGLKEAKDCVEILFSKYIK